MLGFGSPAFSTALAYGARKAPGRALTCSVVRSLGNSYEPLIT